MTGLTSPPYTDEDARSAVDGSNVAVEEANQANVADVASNADNADQLGGQLPSHFETPNSTGNAGITAGWRDHQVSEISDGIRWTADWPYSANNSIYTITVNFADGSSDTYNETITEGTHTRSYNHSNGYINSVSVSLDDDRIDVYNIESHVIGLLTHSHPNP